MINFNRIHQIVRASFIGLIINFLLTLLKFVAGFVSGSVVIINDAIGSLNDFIAGIITILGIKFASMQPDKEHPYGYGQVEFITTTTLAVLEIIAGITGAIECVKEIVEPSPSEYPNLLLIILSVGILARIWLGRYLEKKGETYNSEALKAAGEGTYVNSVTSVATIAAAFAHLYYNVKLEGWFGLFIALFIIKSSLVSLFMCLGDIIGRRVDDELAIPLKAAIKEYPEVLGVYDLMLHRYGIEKIIGSVHVELMDFVTANRVHELTREITIDIYERFGVLLTIGIYASNTDSAENTAMKQRLKELCGEFPEILELHGFYVNEDKRSVFFDLVVDFSRPDTKEIEEYIIGKLKAEYPQYEYTVIIDRDYSV